MPHVGTQVAGTLDGFVRKRHLVAIDPFHEVLGINVERGLEVPAEVAVRLSREEVEEEHAYYGPEHQAGDERVAHWRGTYRQPRDQFAHDPAGSGCDRYEENDPGRESGQHHSLGNRLDSVQLLSDLAGSRVRDVVPEVYRTDAVSGLGVESIGIDDVSKARRASQDVVRPFRLVLLDREVVEVGMQRADLRPSGLG